MFNKLQSSGTRSGGAGSPAAGCGTGMASGVLPESPHFICTVTPSGRCMIRITVTTVTAIVTTATVTSIVTSSDIVDVTHPFPGTCSEFRLQSLKDPDRSPSSHTF